jgi:hypothetical protein
MATIDAKQIIGKETSPAADGLAIAKHLLGTKASLSDLTIDVSALAPEDLVSTFVNTLLHALEGAGISVKNATSIKWQAKYESEAKRLRDLVTYYVQSDAGG